MVFVGMAGLTSLLSLACSRGLNGPLTPPTEFRSDLSVALGKPEIATVSQVEITGKNDRFHVNSETHQSGLT